MEPNALWEKVIKAIHGLQEENPLIIANRRIPGVWLNISKVGDTLASFNLNINELFSRVVGNGDKIRFWKDRWLGSESLNLIYPNLYALEINKDCSVADRVSVRNAAGQISYWAGNGNTLNEHLSRRFGELQTS